MNGFPKTRPGYLGGLTDSQQQALGDIWCFLLHLWYADSARSRSASSNGNEPVTAHTTPASPTRLGQSFHQPSMSSSSPSQISLSFGPSSAATIAALRRSAVKLKPWLPGKKFSFKYSPSEYQHAFWSYVQNEHPDAVVLKFLRAKKWNIEKAMEMLILALEWRISFNVESLLQKSEPETDLGLVSQLVKGGSYLQGRDKQGRPVWYVHIALHNPSAQSEIAVQRLFVYHLENARAMRASSPAETTTFIIDLRGFAMSNMDWPATKFFIHMIENCYPETLGICLIFKAPWICNGVWKVISSLLDPATRQRFQFTTKRKELEVYVSPEQLADGLENVDAHSFKWLPPVSGENQLMEDSETKQKALLRRREMELTFERMTEIWQGQQELVSSTAVALERTELGKKLAESWAEVEPFIRARTVFHRNGEQTSARDCE